MRVFASIVFTYLAGSHVFVLLMLTARMVPKYYLGTVRTMQVHRSIELVTIQVHRRSYSRTYLQCLRPKLVQVQVQDIHG